jgi:prolyl 4-hydroxylase
MQDYIEDLSLCDRLITYYKANPYKQPGGSTRGATDKKSTDIGIDRNEYSRPVVNQYLQELQEILEKYIKKYPMSNYYAPFQIQENINIQHYKPGEGYLGWHTERVSKDEPIGSRHLVFMTYLNDVTDGGGTEFYHQKLTVQAKKGLTLIWPSDWTYTHTGITSPTQEKYIITGWYSFV